MDSVESGGFGHCHLEGSDMKGSGKTCSALGDADVGELGDSEVEIGNLDKPYLGDLGMFPIEESDMSAHPDMWEVVIQS
jgi:hypothetical protein